MKNFIAITILLIGTLGLSSDQVLHESGHVTDARDWSDALGLRRLVCPDYPLVARKAQVTGDVHITVTIMADGSVQVNRASGPAILADYAQKNVRTWYFTQQPTRREIEITYSYKLREPKIDGPVVPSVSFESPTHVLIISNLPMPSGHPE